MNCCDFKVGDEVDWFDIHNSTQGRWWHGVIIEDRQMKSVDGTIGIHNLIVRWALGSSWGKYKRIPSNIWVTPTRNSHSLTEYCSELRHCGEDASLHPSTLHQISMEIMKSVISTLSELDAESRNGLLLIGFSGHLFYGEFQDIQMKCLQQCPQGC